MHEVQPPGVGQGGVEHRIAGSARTVGVFPDLLSDHEGGQGLALEQVLALLPPDLDARPQVAREHSLQEADHATRKPLGAEELADLVRGHGPEIARVHDAQVVDAGLDVERGAVLASEEGAQVVRVLRPKAQLLLGLPDQGLHVQAIRHGHGLERKVAHHGRPATERGSRRRQRRHPLDRDRNLVRRVTGLPLILLCHDRPSPSLCGLCLFTEPFVTLCPHLNASDCYCQGIDDRDFLWNAVLVELALIRYDDASYALVT